MSLTPAFLDELRARTTLSALIGKSVKLTRAGREHKGCCPFHNEKTPSFYVNDDKGFYHCFGCSAHGDAIRWMTDQRGLPFIDAVKELAQVVGLDVPAPDPRAAEKQERAKGLHEACQAAADWFEAQLGGLDGGEALAMLKKRGVSDATRRAFNLGYAPDTRGKLRTALRDFGDATLVEAGLLIQVEGKEPYDRFRGRLMIPIRDPRGRVIAFGGRVIGEGEPKYLNSPDTPLFDKGRTLFNLDRAAAAARKAGRLIVVEGYLDVTSLAQVEIEEVVAPLGTSVTEAQLERLWRVHNRPIMCFDGDAAGQKAAARAATRALPLLAPGQSLGFITLPGGQDPDDFVRERGRDEFERIVAAPRQLLHVLYDGERKHAAIDTPEGRAGLRAALTSLAAGINDSTVQSEYKRALNDVFFEEFGWKRAERRIIGQSVVQTSPRRTIDLPNSFMRSALYGLSRFPAVLSVALEVVSSLHVASERLKPWRDTMVEAVIRSPGLDDDALKAILVASKLKPETARDIQTDLRFPWDVEPEQAVRTLGGLIEFLSEERELNAEIEAVTARINVDLSSEDYLALDRERQALFEARLTLYNFGYRLGGGETEESVS